MSASRTAIARIASAVSATSSNVRALSSLTDSAAAISLPDLPYDYSALEPFISAEIMEIHHTKHHQTYINNLIACMEKLDSAIASGNIAEVIALQNAIKFNGGGHVNHSIFWENLAPAAAGGGGEPTGDLADAITAKWGSFDAFKEKFNAKTVAIQGSGWGWLGYNAESGELEIAACANQDPLAAAGLVPLLGVDVWEHAYYLQYKNVRPEYLNAIWNVVNFGDVQKRFDEARA